MKKQFIIFVIVVSGTACSAVPKAPSDLMAGQQFSSSLDQKAKTYPFWNVHFRGFDVRTAGKTLDVHEKRRMLRHLDLLRFTINTPEFATNVLKGTYRSARAVTSRDGKRTLAVGDYLDPQRLLDIVRYRVFPFTIAKQNINAGAAAVGVVGQSIYLEDFSNPAFRVWSWIAFPDREYWNEGGYLQEGYLSGVIFHELLHNTGFTHGGPSHDTVYGLQGAYTSTLTKEFYAKYQKQIEAFRPFYEELHANELTFTTTIDTPVPPTTPLALSHTEQHIAAHSDDEVVICIVKEDGTHELRVVKASEMDTL